MIKLKNLGKAVLATGTETAFAVEHNGKPLGTAYRADSGSKRGNYTFGKFFGSRARLISYVEETLG